jgi:ADP-heptose:LPS heptosyltransferase
MTPDRMRTIDYWVGVPLCFLVNLVTWPFRRRGRAGAKPKRILFIELSEMGSTILADPAMRKAVGLWNAEPYFLIFRKNAASLALLNTVAPENVLTLRDNSLFTLAVDTISFVLWARLRKIDTVVDLELFSRFTALLTILSGAPIRAGFHRFHNEGLYRGEMLTHKVAYNPHHHIAKNFIALINALDSESLEVPYSKTAIADHEITVPRIVPGEREIETMRKRVGECFAPYEPDRHRIVLINPNASDMLPQRRWPREYFATLSREILKRWPDALILITGAPADGPDAEALRAIVDDARMVNFAGRTSLAELPWLYGLAHLMVTNDSGPGHFAALSDMPTIALFGPESPALYRPLGNCRAISANLACSPCVSAANHRKTACSDPVCMKMILPERVLGEVAEELDRA